MRLLELLTEVMSGSAVSAAERIESEKQSSMLPSHELRG